MHRGIKSGISIFGKRKEEKIETSIKKYKKFLHDDLSISIRVISNGKTYNLEIQQMQGRQVVFKNSINERPNYKKGQIISIEFINEKTGLYETKVKIINKKVSELGTYYTAEIADPIEKKQLRNNYRLPINANVSFTLLPQKLKLYNGIAKDISSGGMLMESAQFIPVDKKIRVVFEIDKKKYKINSTVVKVREDENHNRNLHHIKFDNLTSKEKGELHKFVFNEQKRRLRCGAGTI